MPKTKSNCWSSRKLSLKSRWSEKIQFPTLEMETNIWGSTRRLGWGPDLKNRKINLTFGVFGVIPSYLVKMEHIWYVFRKTKKFGEKIFFQSQNLRFWFLKFDIFEYFRIFEKVKNFNRNLRFCDRKNIFHEIFIFYILHIKYAPSSPNMKV